MPGRSPTASACEPHREWIEVAVRHGRDAMAIWQDLVDDYGFTHSYQGVRRFVVKLHGESTREAHPVIQTAPGEEGQVDYRDGPIVRHPESGKYRRTRLFVFTLGCSHKSVRFLTLQSSSKIWAQLHERAYRGLHTRTFIENAANTPYPHGPASRRRKTYAAAAYTPQIRDTIARWGNTGDAKSG